MPKEQCKSHTPYYFTTLHTTLNRVSCVFFTFHVFSKPHGDPVKLKKGPPCKQEAVHLNPPSFCSEPSAQSLHYMSCLNTFTFYLNMLYESLFHCHIAWRFLIYCMPVVIVLRIVLIVRNSTMHVSPNLYHAELCG